MGTTELAATKPIYTATMSVLEEARIDDLELVAEGAKCSPGSTAASPAATRSTTTHRALACYRLAAGQIVANDVMFAPDLMQVMAGIVHRSPKRLTGSALAAGS